MEDPKKTSIKDFEDYMKRKSKEFPGESTSFLVLYLSCCQEIDEGAPVDETIYEYISEVEQIINEVNKNP
jgi:hypothetical protein